MQLYTGSSSAPYSISDLTGYRNSYTVSGPGSFAAPDNLISLTRPYGDSAGLAFGAGSTSYNLFTSGGSLYECSSPYCGSPYQQAVTSSAALGLCPGNQSAVDLGWTYDRYGNRWSQATTAGSAPQPSFTFTHANNQIDSGGGVGYDAAGNVTSIGSTAFYYDAENRLIQVNGTLGECSTATACYGYDTEGNRAYENVGGTVEQFIYDVQGNRITTDATLALIEQEITFGGRHLGSYTSSNTYFTHADWLGTERMRTNASGALVDLEATLPFGDMQYGANTTSPTSADLFTGQPRDPETGLDYFGARYYSGTLGGWLSPDPAGLAAVDPSNPQTWNRYAYVLNNPVGFIDPNGLYCYDPDSGQEVLDPNGNGYTDQKSCEGGGGAWDPNEQPAPLGPPPITIYITAPYNYTPVLWGNSPSQSASQQANTVVTAGVYAAPPTPWYKNSCVWGAIGTGALNVGVDAIGLIPEGGIVSKVVGNYIGYRGIVAVQQGTKAIQSVKMGTGIASTEVGSTDVSRAGLASSSLGAAGIAASFVASGTPLVGQIISGVSIGVDFYKGWQAVGKCNQ